MVNKKKEKIISKTILDNTVEINALVYNVTGLLSFLNNMSSAVTRYCLEKEDDFALAYIAINTLENKKNKIQFVFRESVFNKNQDECIRFVKEFMEELWNKNIKSYFHTEDIEDSFKSFSILKEITKVSVNNNSNGSKPKI